MGRVFAPPDAASAKISKPTRRLVTMRTEEYGSAPSTVALRQRSLDDPRPRTRSGDPGGTSARLWEPVARPDPGGRLGRHRAGLYAAAAGHADYRDRATGRTTPAPLRRSAHRRAGAHGWDAGRRTALAVAVAHGSR